MVRFQREMNTHLGYLPGCIGRIAEMHATYYARTVGFGVAFEAGVATELSEFCLRYVEDRDGLWLATDRGVIHGSIAIDGAFYAQTGAHLRWILCRNREQCNNETTSPPLGLTSGCG